MEKIIAGRNVNLYDSTKDFIQEGLAGIEAEYHKLTTARVVVEQQKEQFHAEVVIHGKHVQITAHGKAKELHPAITLAIDKADRQLRKHLDKVHNHNHLPAAELELISEAEADDEEGLA